MIPPLEFSEGSGIVRVPDALEDADLRVLDDVDRLAVHDHRARADGDRRPGVGQFRVAPDVDLVAHQLVVRADLARELDFLRAERAPGALRAAGRARRSRSAARSRPRPGSRAAPGRGGSGTGRTRRPSARRTRPRCAPARPRWPISTMRSTISIGGAGSAGKPVGRRVLDERPVRQPEHLDLRERRPLQELGVLHSTSIGRSSQPAAGSRSRITRYRRASRRTR